MKKQQTASIYTCQRKDCSNKADFKFVHKRYDKTFQYICDEHLNDDVGHLMREEYIPIKITEEQED
ncbi:MAG TPA: hypothetical protein VHT73_09470 [Thermodesulfobacteriota bacterium]|nr:hypothetical protein [Thermodesulfobacteriota bacterium]